MLKRFSIILAVWAWAGVAFAATPPTVWTPLSAGGTAIYNADGTVCQWTSGGNCAGTGGGGGSNAAAGPTGSAVPANASYTAGNFGGILKGWTFDTNGYGDVNVMNTVAVSIASLPTGAVTIASGGVASGAYASGAIAAGAIVNGADVVEGNNTDAAACTSGTSILACDRKIDADINTVNATAAAGLAASSAIIGKVGIDQTTPGTTNNVSVGALASGGTTPFHVLSAASNNATLVSTGVHTLYALVIAGTNTAIGDVRIYDSSGSPTCSSATGVILNFPVITTAGLEGGLVVPIPAQGIVLANGLAYCVTGANADNDNTNAPTGINVNGAYK